MSGKTLIIGCSGKELVGLEELSLLKRSIYFVNATSKLKELKYSNGFGINNTRHRLNLIFGEEAHFSLRNEDENKVLAELEIPIGSSNPSETDKP